MPNIHKINFKKEIERRFGKLKKLPNSLSLFDLPNDTARIYIRYSKVHGRNQSFYGLREEDLKQLEGLNSFICFIWDSLKEPLFIPFAEFEEIFHFLTPASDGQYKAQIFHQADQNELYLANAGRFNVESFFGWEYFEEQIDTSKIVKIPDFSHSQIQTLIGSIGVIKGFDIWVPPIDRNKLDWKISTKFNCVNELPSRYEKVNGIIREVDVIWVKRGSSDLQAMFEVEHSTPIYSGLLRFNDLHLIEPNLKPRFSIVSNEIRRALFQRQVNRPTFKSSGLSELCNFLEYKDVFGWFNRTIK
ncbi:MAG: hypothetical protein R2783_09330, partial [Gelidibacter sp.]